MTNKLNENALQGFLEYAQEANSRSTLAVEDGLKPVHRRILYAMSEGKITSTKPHVKSAKVVGEVLGNYHPHGDTSVYDAAIRLSQVFKLRYPLIDFYGNAGSILEPDSYAAARYTSMRLTPLGEMMLQDIDKNSVDMMENYSGDLLEPVILPSMIPNILLNGGMGIGVGVSSSLVPHNLKEVCDAITAFIDNPRITTDELMVFMPGPDFPTGGVITDAFSLPSIYESGKGTIKLRAKYKLEVVSGRTHIVVTEVPYLINIESRIIAPIQQMVTEEDYDQIYDIQNNSGKNRLELRIILEKDVNPNAVLQTLFARTGLETTIKINQTVMMSDKSYVTLNLRGLIAQYLKHQHNVIIRKTNFDLQKALERLNIVDGLIIAVQNIDEVVATIKKSDNSAMAKSELMTKFSLNELQAQAILDMRLARLTSLEIFKLKKEKEEIERKIIELNNILNNVSKREEIVKDFLKFIKTKFGDERRTRVAEMKIIEKGEHVYLMVDGENRFTTVAKDNISVMSRGKRGASAIKTVVKDILYCNTKDTIGILDSKGKLYAAPISELLNEQFKLENDAVKLFHIEEKDYLIFVTKDGIIKKTPNFKFKKGNQGTKVKDGDEVSYVFYANDNDFIMALGTEGRVVNLAVSGIASLGKATYGSKGIVTPQVLAAAVVSTDDLVLTMTSENKAKLTKHEDFVLNSKGSMGSVITDDCVYLMNVGTSEFLTIFGEDGKAMSTRVDGLSVKSKNSIGAKIYNSKIDKIIVT